MRIAGITRQGLAAMTVAVALLWSCLVAERVMLRHARRELTQSMQEIRRLRQTSSPVNAPLPGRRHTHARTVVAG